MHLAYITETFPPEVNGVSLTVARTVAWLGQRGHRVQLVRPRQPGEAACDNLQEWRTFGRPIPMYPDLRFGLASPGALRRRFQRSRPQLVHLATPGPLAWAALLAARSLGIATSADFRTNFHQYSRHYGLGALEGLVLAGLRQFHNRTHCSFVPTRAAQRELGAAGFERLCVVGRGVDTRRFDPARRDAALRASWGAQGDAPVLLYVGRLAAEKNVGLALQAFERVRALRPEARMWVVGDGPQRQRLQRAHPAASFVGMLHGDALAAAYASADIFLFPSVSDTFGNVTLEALASGLGVVAFRRAAAAEHIEHGRSGLLLTPGDDGAFTESACQLATQPERLQALRPQARAAACAAQWDEVQARFERQLQCVIEGYGVPSATSPIAA